MTDGDNVTVTVTISPDLLQKIDARAKALDLNRSQYLRRLAREDLDQKELAHQEELKLTRTKEAVAA